MGDHLLRALAWMPHIHSFCGSWDAKTGAGCSVVLYMLLTIFSSIKPLLTISYHHECETFIAYIQLVCAYVAAFCAFFAFYISLPICFTPEKECLPIKYNIFTQLFLCLCLVVSFCEICWGTWTFVRAFVEPGLISRSNRTTNPWRNEVCRVIRCRHYEDRRKNRRCTTCRPLTPEEERMKEQWEKKHENDTVYMYDTKPFDLAFSFLFVLIHIYGLYPLMALRSHLADLQEEEEDTNTDTDTEQ